MLTDSEKKKRYDSGQMDFEGDTGAENMGEFFQGGMGNPGGNVKFSFNGQDMGGSGVDPSEILKMFFNGGGSDLGGFGRFGGMGGQNRQEGTKRSSSKFKDF